MGIIKKDTRSSGSPVRYQRIFGDFIAGLRGIGIARAGTSGDFVNQVKAYLT
ncbi:unnamed protein product [Anisakis simplex]|uniref:Uncharacterized protein n=1 Tax=Anisakis simplex TaxID=6269 RepID=A0A3P6P4X6_ANISI|nr:unnamed protein product [Anisakis simplex]